MRRVFLIASFCALVAVSLDATAVAESQRHDPREQAMHEAWGWAVLVATVLERGDNNDFPGIRAWLADFRRVEAAMPPTGSDARFPTLDADALVRRNPRFWSACYEIAPGDPGWALLHAALLLCGGEAQRAAVIATLGLQREGAAPEFQRALATIVVAAYTAQAGSQTLVREGVTLHDVGLFDNALGKFDAALAAWPANGRAYFERGSTLRMKALADAALKRRISTASGDDDAPVPDPPGTRDAFAEARRHDPFCVMAYQGDDPAALTGMMALVRTALPIWESIRKRPEAPATREELRDLAESCRDAGIPEYSLAAHQQFVARNRHYNGGDAEFIASCVDQLASGVDIVATLVRIGNDARLARQIAAPESPDNLIDPTVGGEAFAMAQLAAAEARMVKEANAVAAKEAAAKARAKSKSKTKKRKSD